MIPIFFLPNFLTCLFNKCKIINRCNKVRVNVNLNPLKEQHMIRTIKIKCPYCDEISELFLSINPTIIVLNCPECWTPILYDKDEVRTLSSQEISKIVSSPQHTQGPVNSLFDKITKQQSKKENYIAGHSSTPFTKRHIETNVATSHFDYSLYNSAERKMISEDDITNLRIELGQSKDVLEFINIC